VAIGIAWPKRPPKPTCHGEVIVPWRGQQRHLLWLCYVIIVVEYCMVPTNTPTLPRMQIFSVSNRVSQYQHVSTCINFINLYQLVSTCINLNQLESTCKNLYQLVSDCINLFFRMYLTFCRRDTRSWVMPQRLNVKKGQQYEKTFSLSHYLSEIGQHQIKRRNQYYCLRPSQEIKNSPQETRKFPRSSLFLVMQHMLFSRN